MVDSEPQEVLIGAGGHAKVVVEALDLLDRKLAGYLASEVSGDFDLFGKYLGGDEMLSMLQMEKMKFTLGLGFVNAKGAQRRAKILDNIGPYLSVSVIHPDSSVSKFASLENGVFAARGSCIGPGVRMHVASIANTGSIIDHDCKIGENTHIAIGAVLGGGVVIGRNVLVGAGSTILQGIEVGDNAIIGAGSVIKRDVEMG